MLIRELLAMGALSIGPSEVLAGSEEEFHRNLGLRLNEGALEYLTDRRRHVVSRRRTRV